MTRARRLPFGAIGVAAFVVVLAGVPLAAPQFWVTLGNYVGLYSIAALGLVLLTGVFVYAFFRFTWSLRQYSFGALLVASAPEHTAFADEAARERFADKAGGVVGLAAETFNDGLRAYYFAFAAAAWLFSPLAFAVGTAGVVWVLYQREFPSEAFALMRG